MVPPSEKVQQNGVLLKVSHSDYKTGGGHMTFYPYEKGGGGRQSFSHAEGDAQNVLYSFHMVVAIRSATSAFLCTP